MDKIVIRGARTHNLKNINLTLPRDKMCVITGLSGSGKSSLAFDTLYAEGQRRYVESLSAYARQFLQLMDKPDVDSIEGLSPAISIEQKSTSRNPRSTVGTVTEIHDYLRLLFARIGIAVCPEHGIELKAQTVSQMVDQTLAYAEGTKLMILAPVVRGRKGEYKQLFAELASQGFIRARVDGEICDLSDPPDLQLHIKHHIEVVVDRFKVKADIKQRLAESFETALKTADGLAMLVPMDEHTKDEEIILSSSYSCPECGYSIPELEPRNFSFNSPHGACPKCDGLGKQMVFSEERVVPDPNKSIEEGAIALWDKRSWSFYRLLVPACDEAGIDIYKPFKDLTRKEQEIVLYGNADTKKDSDRSFMGVIGYFERQAKESDSESYQAQLQNLMSTKVCPECHGARLKHEYCHVFVGGKSLPQINDMSISDSYEFFSSLSLGEQDSTIAERILKEVRERLMFLKNVGLGYLNLSRSADTLSGGEAQRIRLASQIGAGLVGVMYVLDEPSIGLHQRDNQRLLDALARLRDLGNSVIVVEHDEDAIRQADYIVDIGPGAGVHGGNIVTMGSPEEIMKCEQSLTADYLTGRKQIALPTVRHSGHGFLRLSGCKGNNLKNVTASFPAGCFIAVTGVSGSGKSTLVNDTLVPVVSSHMKGGETIRVDQAFDCQKVEGVELFDKLICIDQSPIGRTPRSNPATYIDLFTGIRELFAMTPESRARGYTPGRFSFNVKGGRCEACQGDGTIRVEMHFLPDVYVQCEQCKGKRYNRETLDIHYKGKNISEVLDMTVEEALTFFEAVPKIRRKLQALMDVGLSYITLGQSALTFSGGEAQRIKLAKELSKVSTKNTLYVLDEPTTGLHFHDVKQLLDMLMRLRDDGNTVVVIEHNLDVIKCADYIIDLGPEGGSGGGQIIATGTPEQIALNDASFTGQFLKPILLKAGSIDAKGNILTQGTTTDESNTKVDSTDSSSTTKKTRAKPKAKPKAKAKSTKKAEAEANEEDDVLMSPEELHKSAADALFGSTVEEDKPSKPKTRRKSKNSQDA
ncbi:MAG: excinuclease ABC subunit UvrA [Anaerobiospirillum succiniciproducens]|uniref:excinuclease ABC subunit UvrA n=1 Tax=Anaerobiospirillum succiniciproducens TaxID=13335 RepID=UPI0026DD13D7|nr:excinuclease ABC subunit UvrA [Anaerobiospirillum succiniciproducens]MDO4676419.1 excinuclease ABC subunit UvrA [Anaerobiospirillum succiniciproducens]